MDNKKTAVPTKETAVKIFYPQAGLIFKPINEVQYRTF